jgi:Domain of unknown function (DUF6429)
MGKGYISSPVGKAKSVVFTEEGLKEVERLCEQLFGKQRVSQAPLRREKRERTGQEWDPTLRVWREHLKLHGKEGLCTCEFQVGRFCKGQRIAGCGIAAASGWHAG